MFPSRSLAGAAQWCGRVSLFLTCLATSVLSQDDGVRIASAWLAGDDAQARELAAAVTEPAAAARLAATLRPASQRAAAWIAAARAWPDGPEADRMLLAASAQVLADLGRGEAVPERAQWEALVAAQPAAEDLEWTEQEAPSVGLRGVIEALAAALEERAWHATEPSPDRERALRNLELARVTLFDDRPVRIRADAVWELPQVGEELLLGVRPVLGGRLGWRGLLDAGAPPSFQQSVVPAVGGGRGWIAPLPPGAWLVEWRSRAQGSRAVRAVEVSDLEVFGLVGESRFAVAGVVRERDGFGDADEDARQLAAWLRGGAGPRSRLDLAHGTVGVVDPAAGILDLRDERGHPATIELPRPRRVTAARPATLAHLMVDRPIYRRGETIQGRVVVHACSWQGEGLDATVTTSPARAKTVWLRAFVGAACERLLELHCDASGQAGFEVVVPEELSGGDARFALDRAPQGRESEVRILDARPCRVAEFVRPALHCAVDGPRELPAEGGSDAVDLVLTAAWASGGPAAGLDVDVAVGGFGEKIATRLTTDAEGRATLHLDVTALPPGGWIEAAFDVVTPAGRTLRSAHRLRRALEGGLTSRPGRVVHPPEGVVGEWLQVELHGRAGQQVLVVRGRGAALAAEVVELDHDGCGQYRVEPRADEWPVLDLAVADGAGFEAVRIPLTRRAPIEPAIALPEQVAPGAAFDLDVAVGRPGVVVTAVVVDARIYDLAADRTPSPRAALVPDVDRERLAHFATDDWCEPLAVLAGLLVDGQVPPLGTDLWAAPGSPGAGGPAMPGLGAAPPLRDEFRATAVFATAVTGADGIATIPVQMPDDLADWRVTVVGVAPDGDGFVQQRALHTRLPLAAEPRLPRLLRVGDRVDVPVLVDAAAATDGAAPTRHAVHIEAALDGAAALVGERRRRCEVDSGSTATTAFTLSADRPGEAALELAIAVQDAFAEAGARQLDRSRRLLPVLPDAVLRPVSTVAFGVRGRFDLAIPAGVSAAHGLEVTVVAGRPAVRALLRERLERYPYGCVEQTLSSILPFFAEARGRHAAGERLALPDDPEFRARLGKGLARLRELQTAPGGGFAWWSHDGEADPEMTALVLHGLCVLREAGHEPAELGLRCDPDQPLFRAALQRATSAELCRPADLELAAALLRTRPDHAGVRDVVPALLIGALDDSAAASRQRLDAPGLAARAGLALWVHGDRRAAEACLHRAGELAATRTAFPGEDPLAVAALRLELRHRLVEAVGFGTEGVPSLEREALALRRRLLDGRASTYASATALAALALVDAGRTEAVTEGQVTLLADGRSTAVVWSADTGYRATLRVPELPESLAVQVGDGVSLDVVVTGSVAEPGSTHDAWSTPLEVARRLGIRDRETGELRVVPSGQPLRRGSRYEVEVTVHSPRDTLRYLVVEVPLPAGFELACELPGVEVFDDRAACTIAWLPAGRRWTRALPLVPTRTGTMAWPPVVARTMYGDGVDGGSAGSVLVVTAAESTAGGDSVVAAALRAPVWTADPEVVEQRTPAEVHLDQLAECWERVHLAWRASLVDVPGAAWSREFAPTAAARAELDDALAAFLEFARREPVLSLESLSDLLQQLPVRDARGVWRERVGAGARVQRGEALGSGLVARLTALRALWQEAQGVVLEQMQSGELAVDPDIVHESVRAAWLEAPTAERERQFARILEVVAGRGPRQLARVVACIDAPVRTAELADVLWRVLPAVPAADRPATAELLPADRLVLLPWSQLRSLLSDGADASVWDAVSADPVAAARLRSALDDPELVQELAWQVDVDCLARLDGMPLRVWSAVPGYVLREPAALRWLVDSDFATDELIAAWCAAIERRPDDGAQRCVEDPEDWRFVLAEVLRRRGVDGPGPLGPEASGALRSWARALGSAARRDVEDLLALRETVLEGDDLLWCGDGFLDFVDHVVHACGSVEQIAATLGERDEVDWAALRDRLGVAACVALLDRAPAGLDTLPDFDLGPSGPLAAVRHALRTAGCSMADVAAAACATEAGAECMQRFVAAGGVAEAAAGLDVDADEVAALAAELSQELAERLGSDATPEARVVRLAGRWGLERNWTVDERPVLERILQLRGF